MKSYLLVLTFICLSSCTVFGDQKLVKEIVPQQWSYKQFLCDANLSTDLLQLQLESLGKQGWELTGVIARRTATGSDILLFKRMMISDDVDIIFQPEIGIVTVRGSKDKVDKLEKVLNDIQANTDAAKSTPKP